ncbi:histone-lysine N-methyltransferase 2b-like [Plakobranchus ocellatus]|uniref:Histone-lysine N-methyltransferase 2b-like n=1 Tax=Plakobranchus ocellatus TaxID=259542 RepID=A0AAV3Z1I9_9GAST|nr:histone-lysine N-methyltransferase 2b-like [Plakobranchus ocellatus]
MASQMAQWLVKSPKSASLGAGLNPTPHPGIGFSRRGGRGRAPVKGVNRAPVDMAHENARLVNERETSGHQGRVIAPAPMKVVRTDNVRKSSNPYPFPGPEGLRRLRHIAYAAWFIAILKSLVKKKGGARPSSVFLFGIILKEMVAALHRIYLNPNGNIYPVMQDVIGPNAQDLSELLYRPGPPPEAVRGGRAGGGRGRGGDENAGLFQILQYVIENIIYHMTEIMPKTGVLGTHKKAAVFELIKSNKRFPDGYFWQIELRACTMRFSRFLYIASPQRGDLRLLPDPPSGQGAGGMSQGGLASHSATDAPHDELLMRPVDYGLSNEALSDTAERNLKVVSTALLFIVRRVSVKRESPMLPMPGEVARYVFADEEMRPLHLRLRRTYEYCENLLREWGAEYIKRLRQAANVTTTTTAAPAKYFFVVQEELGGARATIVCPVKRKGGSNMVQIVGILAMCKYYFSRNESKCYPARKQSNCYLARKESNHHTVSKATAALSANKVTATLTAIKTTTTLSANEATATLSATKTTTTLSANKATAALSANKATATLSATKTTTVTSESALRSAGTFCRGFEPRHRRPGLSEDLKA